LTRDERIDRGEQVTSPYDEDIERSLGEYRDQVSQLGRTARRMRELTASATAPRRTVTATVGAQGELLGLEFPTGAYRQLPPAELASIIVATVAEARREVAGRVTELIAPSMPSGFDAAAVLAGSADLAGVLPHDPQPAPAVQDYLERGRGGDARAGG
jgi:hypothetical protein